MALKEAIKEAIYLNSMFQYLNNHLDLGYTARIPRILVDSDSAKKLAENPEFHKRSKYIKIIYHFNRQAIQEEKVELIYIPRKYQLADFLTKNKNNLLYIIFMKIASLGSSKDI